MSMEELAADLLAEIAPDWEVENDYTLICPCGHHVEWDGGCPDGCISPLLEGGII